MKRIFIASFALFLGLTAVAQEKKNLTLDEAVLGQFRQFYPEQLQLEWIPGTDRYSHIKNDILYSQSAMGKSNPTVELRQMHKNMFESAVLIVKRVKTRENARKKHKNVFESVVLIVKCLKTRAAQERTRRMYACC
jgi:hypothetical protein